MYTVYKSDADCPVGYSTTLGGAQLIAQDHAHRHRGTTCTVKDPGGSLVYTAPVRVRVGAQGT